MKSFIAHISSKAYATNTWYFDNGCSRHMTGDKNILIDYQGMLDGYVTFGDGLKEKVLRKKNLMWMISKNWQIYFMWKDLKLILLV